MQEVALNKLMSLSQAQDAVTEFGWPMYKVEPLQESEKKDIIHGFMGLYGKTLNQEQTDLIIHAKQSSNPLYLKALLDEVKIRIFIL